MRLGLGIKIAKPSNGASAAAFANGQSAPTGFRWEFVTDRATGERVTDLTNKNQPVVTLVGK